MTSFITRENRLVPYNNALSKLAPHQTEQILLIFDMAARMQFGNKNPSRKIIDEIGHEKITEISLEEFLDKVSVEVEKLPKPEFKIYTDL